MKRLALFSAVLMGSTTLATAADLYSAPPIAPDVTFAPAAFNWTGIYAGIHGGFGGDKFEFPYNLDFGPDSDRGLSGEPDVTSSGFFAGGQVGANWQFAPQWVVGVVGDASWSDIKGEVGLNVNYNSPADEPPTGTSFNLFDVEAGSQVNWFSTMRARLGFLPTERFMVYGTGGAAVGETKSYLKGSTDFDDGASGEISSTGTEWGWAAGAGFEYAVTNNITLNTEYLYVDLGSQNLLSGPNGSLDVDTHFHTIKAGLNFLWGNSGGSGADMPYYAPVETASALSWTGIYAGIQGGFGGDKFEFPYNLDFGPDSDRGLSGEPDVTSSGFFAGGQVGANWQFAPQWVVGVVGDASWSDIKGEVGLNVNYNSPADEPPTGTSFNLFDVEAGSQVNWFSTMRARLGFLPTERFMVYGTGGAAVGETKSYLKGSTDFDGGASGEISSTGTEWGWSAGAGFEYAVTNNITLNTEYLYVDLGSQNLLSGPNGSLDVDTHFHTIKAGVNFLFN